MKEFTIKKKATSYLQRKVQEVKEDPNIAIKIFIEQNCGLDAKFNKDFIVFIDRRGDVEKYFIEYLSHHPLLKSQIDVVGINNLKADMIVVRNKTDITDYRVTWLIEFCLTDMRAKLMSNQLINELWGDPNNNYILMKQLLNAEHIAVIGAETYSPMTYQILNSTMQECKSIYVYLPTTIENAIKKAIRLIVGKPPTEETYYPVLKTDVLNKQFALSISALMNGVSPGLGLELAKIWHKDITELEISKVVDNFINRNKIPTKRKHYGKLANKIYNRFQETWGNDIEGVEFIEEPIKDVNFDELEKEIDDL